jgi:predicted DNA-binding transcriptional regulator YafY
VERLQGALVRRHKVRLTYGTPPSERLVDPWGLVDKDDTWYLLAGTDRGQRTFRVDRVTTVVETEVAAERPADFELAAAWKGVVDAMEHRRSLVAATVLINPRYVPVLQTHFGRHCTVVGPADDGRTRVRVAAHMPRALAEQLAGWGSAVEVVEPPEVREELARIGAELVERYHA